MPLPKNRSTSVRKIFRKTPQGLSIAYRRRKSGGKHSCAICGALLQGVTSARGITRSARRPTRKFAGHLCARCAAKAVVYKSRLADGAITPDDIEVSFKRYVQ